MTDDLLLILTLFAALGCGLVAGVFFAFSTFVMAGLGRLRPEQGIASMQSINVTAISPVFMTALFGTAVACIVLAISSLFRLGDARVIYLLAGSGLYLIGVVLVTIIFNLPRNDALAAVDPASDEGARLWASYLDTWTAWNHVRTITGLAATAAFILALR